MNESFQKCFVDMVILKTCRHLFVKISWLPWRHYVNIYWLVAGLAELCVGVEKVAVIRTVDCPLHFFGLIHLIF